MKNHTKIQQGDVILRRLSSMPQGAQKKLAAKKCVLAHGESGHSHVVEETDAELIAIGERMLLSVPNGGTVQHEEHGAVTLSPGIWEIGRVREKDWFQDMVRNAQD